MVWPYPKPDALCNNHYLLSWGIWGAKWCCSGQWSWRDVDMTLHVLFARALEWLAGWILTAKSSLTLQWRHNDHDSVSNHQPHGCLLNRLFGRRSKKTSKLRVTGFCAGNSQRPMNFPHKVPVTRKMFPFDDVIMICQHWFSWCHNNARSTFTMFFLRHSRLAPGRVFQWHIKWKIFSTPLDKSLETLQCRHNDHNGL